MRLADLDYDLPPERIAQHPADRREDARLLVVERSSHTIRDARFLDLGDLLVPGDAFAVNETKVRPARLGARRSSGGRVELLFLRPEGASAWRVLARPAKRANVGATLDAADGELVLEIVDAGEHGERVVRVARGDLEAALEAHGEMPLPPYIHRAPDAADRERYQTVFARVAGAVAAPTAGLHFSAEHVERLRAQGYGWASLLLHVGPGTFRPIVADDPSDHRMDEESFDIPASSVEVLRAARARGRRIVAVGTTSVRALESACDANAGELGPARGWTRKFIVPPYRFRAVDALLTNFHLPRTTLLLLVAAFAGEELLRRAYAHAIRERYRFYSYGDAMLVL